MTNLELKSALLVLRAEVTALRDRVGKLESRQIHPQAVVHKEQKMCPHCNAQPAYYFHVKYCKANKNKNNGANKEADG